MLLSETNTTSQVSDIEQLLSVYQPELEGASSPNDITLDRDT